MKTWFGKAPKTPGFYWRSLGGEWILLSLASSGRWRYAASSAHAIVEDEAHWAGPVLPPEGVSDG